MMGQTQEMNVGPLNLYSGDHGTNCIKLLNGMRERMTVKTRNQTLALESL